jgi:ATP-binding cassette, subfamily F, member 3
MFQEIVEEILVVHDEFSAEELEEICQDFYDTIPKKIKEETKLKRVRKYMRTEFEMEESNSPSIPLQWGGSGQEWTQKEYSLETLPRYLFEGKTKIASWLINIVDLALHIGWEALFSESNLKINKADKVALIWKNGAGKTTLLKLILARAGILENEKTKFLDLENMDGQIELAPDMKIWYLSQDLFWSDTKNTLREEIQTILPSIAVKIERIEEMKNNPNMWEETNILNKELIELDGYKKYTLLQEIHRYFGISDEHLDYNVLKLSGGEQTKIQIAKFLIWEVDILILDEPTNHLDIDGIIFLEYFCQVWKKAIICISHDVRFINNTCKRIAEISGNQIHNYAGNYDYYVEEKKERYEKQMRDYNNQQKEIETTEAYINRFRANSAKASSVQSRIKALDKIDVLRKPENETLWKFIHIKSNMRLPEVIMKLKNLEVWYTFPLVTLPEYIEVRKNDKIGIIGKNGSGKTTLLKTILGDIPALDGESDINERVKIGGYAQVLEWLDISNSILKELSKDHDNQQEIRTMLGWLLITGDKVDQTISTLSGWERAKVALAKMLLSAPDIIVMDEPTNHLDIHSKQVIKKMLQSFSWTTLIVSHDRDLLESVSNKLWLIKRRILSAYDEPEKGFREIF